jgi:hypothetical protein
MCEEQVLLNRFSPEIQLCCARPVWSQSSTAPPPLPMYEEGARLHRRSHQSPQKLYRNYKKNSGSWDQSLISLQRYRIIKHTRGRHLNLKKTVRTANIIASVANDQRIGTRSLHAAHGV